MTLNFLSFGFLFIKIESLSVVILLFSLSIIHSTVTYDTSFIFYFVLSPLSQDPSYGEV